MSEVKGVKVSELDPKLEEFASVYSSFVFCIFLMGAKMQKSVRALILAFSICNPHATALSEPERDGHPSNQPRRPGAIFVFLFFF